MASFRAARALAWLAVFFGAPGCTAGAVTQVLVRLDADQETVSQACQLRVRVLDHEGAGQLDVLRRISCGVPEAALPATVPLVPRGGDATRTYTVIAELMGSTGATISEQRAIGGYVAGQTLEVVLRFDDACLGERGCTDRETCVEGACVSACVTPTPLGAVTRSVASSCPVQGDAGASDGMTPCGECNPLGEGACEPLPDHTPCTAGQCRSGICCGGCSDGSACHAGDELEWCGAGGDDCRLCLCPTDACTGGACTVTVGIASLGLGSRHSCGVSTTDELYCWGSDASQQLGDGGGADPASALRPIRIGTESDWASPSAGEAHTCALRGGTVWCWGANAMGQLGLGAPSGGDAPAQVGTSSDWTTVDAGGNHTCAVRAGTLWCWGANDSGQLGLGDQTNRAAPLRVGTSAAWTLVSAGRAHTCAIDTSGALYCWGDDSYGQVGTTAMGDLVTSPMRVSGTAEYFRDVAAGADHTCAVRRNGSLFCWGRNHRGQLGIGSTTASIPSPARVGTAEDWSTVRAGADHTCALKSTGTLHCWGDNAHGQLGVGAPLTMRNAPASVGPSVWQTIDAGATHTCAARGAHGLRCWGNGADGVLGAGDETTRSAPYGICVR